MAKRKGRRRRKKNGKFLWLIAGITAAATFSMGVYMLILTKQSSECREGHIPRCLQRCKLDAPLLAAGLLTVSMVEDVKGRGGSGYVVGKDKEVLESWFVGNP